MITCLDNIIGILGCGTPSEDTILFINQLPGVSLEMIDSLADDEQESFMGVWEDVKLRAKLKFVLAVKAELNKCYKINSDTVAECLICEHSKKLAVSLWYLMGTELMIERTSSSRLNRYTTIDLDQAKELKSEFYVEFQACLKDAIGSINPVESDCVEGCLDCNEDIRFVEQTPGTGFMNSPNYPFY